MKKLRISTIVCLILSVFTVWIMYMLMLPAINLRAASFYWFLACGSAAVTAVFLIRDFFGVRKTTSLSKIMGIVTTVMVAICIILTITNSALFTAKTIQKIPELSEGNFEEDYVEISNNPAEAFTLDLDSAERLGNRAIGNIENASWYEVNNEFNLITYQGVKYRVSPLEYGDLFKYFKASNVGIPGYVLVNMDMNDETWYVVRNTRGVTGFVGHGSDPIPLTKEEIVRMGIEKLKIDLDIEVGDTVRIIGGVFEGQLGIVEAINPEKQIVKTRISMFGRDTPAEIEFSQVSKLR